MASILTRLSDAVAVQAALDEFVRLGRSAFLRRYGFSKSRNFLVRDPKTETLCDFKAIVGVAYAYQFPREGPLRSEDFSGEEAAALPKLKSLGFEVFRIGEDWTADEVTATVQSYFEMLRREAQQQRYNKSEFNATLRKSLRGRSKASVELKHQNISAVLHEIGLPFINGYKPRGNSQLLLRQAVQRYVIEQREIMGEVVEAMQEVITAGERNYKAVVVDPPTFKSATTNETPSQRIRLPRKIDFASRDEANRTLGRAGEKWVIGFEQQRLNDVGLAELFAELEWTSEERGDGAGYDIRSHDSPRKYRYIEVKTTNGPHDSSFASAATNWISRGRRATLSTYIEYSGFANSPAFICCRETYRSNFTLSRWITGLRSSACSSKNRTNIVVRFVFTPKVSYGAKSNLPHTNYVPPTKAINHTSIFPACSAFNSMNALLGSTSSPISVVKI